MICICNRICDLTQCFHVLLEAGCWGILQDVLSTTGFDSYTEIPVKCIDINIYFQNFDWLRVMDYSGYPNPVAYKTTPLQFLKEV